MKYKTKHRDELINYLRDNSDRHLTIQEISQNLDGKIPQATIYRLINKFLDEGLVRKYMVDPTLGCCYQLTDNDCHEHFHLVCEKCGKVIHLECDEVGHLLKHINNDHNFEIDTSKVNLYGICEDCKKAQ